MEAIPTEYKGIVFRSKSEAQFAFMLDNSSMLATGWVYEPNNLRCKDGYIPDFLLFQKQRIIIIEYKPIEPTTTYLEMFYRHMNEIIEKDLLDLISGYTIIYGSVYTNFSIMDGHDFKRFEVFNSELRQKALEHRFDLKQ